MVSCHGKLNTHKLACKYITYVCVCICIEFQIPYGQKYDKDFLVKALLGATHPVIFIPHYWKVEATSVSFYVDDIEMARALLNVDRNIELPDGFKLIIKVRNSVPPVNIDANLRELMRRTMETRYSPATRALDLTKFHADPLLNEVYCGLARPTIMVAAIDIIAENIPDLEALNLDGNKISNLDHFKQLVNKLPNLKILYMANNKVRIENMADEYNSQVNTDTKDAFLPSRSPPSPHWKCLKTATSSTWC